MAAKGAKFGFCVGAYGKRPEAVELHLQGGEII